MKIKQRLAVVVTVLVTLTGIGLINASPASAVTCASGNLCGWTSQWEEGSQRTMSLSPGTCINLSYPWDNNFSSFWNRSSSRYYVFTAYNCTITPATKILEPGWEYLVMESTFDNTISSIQRAS
jgi:hypothetical protein